MTMPGFCQRVEKIAIIPKNRFYSNSVCSETNNLFMETLKYLQSNDLFGLPPFPPVPDKHRFLPVLRNLMN